VVERGAAGLVEWARPLPLDGVFEEQAPLGDVDRFVEAVGGWRC